MPIQYTVIFHGCKNDYFQTKNYDIFLIFAQNIDCGYTLEPPLSVAVLTSTHNLCFGAKIRKNVYPCKPQFYYIKVRCKGVFITRTCFRDDMFREITVLSNDYHFTMYNFIHYLSAYKFLNQPVSHQGFESSS